MRREHRRPRSRESERGACSLAVSLAGSPEYVFGFASCGVVSFEPCCGHWHTILALGSRLVFFLSLVILVRFSPCVDPGPCSFFSLRRPRPKSRRLEPGLKLLCQSRCFTFLLASASSRALFCCVAYLVCMCFSSAPGVVLYTISLWARGVKWHGVVSLRPRPTLLATSDPRWRLSCCPGSGPMAMESVMGRLGYLWY